MRYSIAFLTVLFSLLIGVPVVAGDDPQVILKKESLLPEGVLPTWETTTEKAARKPRPPRVYNADDGLLPPPPAVGFRIAAEFEPLSAYLVSQGDWGGNQMMIDLIVEGSKDGGARAVVLTRSDVESFEANLASRGVDLIRASVIAPPNGLDAKWARDYGPLSIYEAGENGEDGPLALVDMHYYDGRQRDDVVSHYLVEEIGLTRYGTEGRDFDPADEYLLYMEGGNFQTDGRGTCILSNDVPEDNEGNSDADTLEKVETILAEYMGCDRVIWLTPVPNSGTGHVDMYSKLLSPTDILVIDVPNQDGIHAEISAILEDNIQILEAASFDVHRITIPPVANLVMSWVYKTYTNSTIINDIVLVPTYNAPAYDDEALDVYREIMGPQYSVVGINAASIAAQGGAVHCTTMQISSACGNGRRDPIIEACEGDDLGDETCESLGFASDQGQGELACKSNCRFELSGCDDTIEPPEDTDVDNDTELNDTDTIDDSTDEDTSDSDTGGADSDDLSPGTGCGCTQVRPDTSSLIGVILNLF